MKPKIQAIIERHHGVQNGEIHNQSLEEATNAILELVVEELDGLEDYLLAPEKAWLGNWLLNGLLESETKLEKDTLEKLENAMREWVSFFIQDRISKLRQ